MDDTTQFQLMLLPLAALAATIGYMRNQILCLFHCPVNRHPVVLFASNLLNQTLRSTVVLRNTVLHLMKSLFTTKELVVKLLSDFRVMLVTSIQGILVTIHRFTNQTVQQFHIVIQSVFTSAEEKTGLLTYVKPFLPTLYLLSLLALVGLCLYGLRKMNDGDRPFEFQPQTPAEASPVEEKKPVRRRNRRVN